MERHEIENVQKRLLEMQRKFPMTMDIQQQSLSFLQRETFHVPYPAIISGDRHIPWTSLHWHEYMMDVAKRRGIKTLIESGDYFNQDVFAFWFQSYQPLINLDWEAEIDAATEIMNDLLSWFDNIYIIIGNHDLRIWRKVGRGQNFQILFKLITQDPRVHVSNLPYCYVGPEDEYMVVHPKSYSQISTATPKRLVEKFHKHVIGAHGHFLGVDYDRSGKYMAVASGGLFDYDTILYTHASITTHDMWVNGFCVLNERGELRLYGPGMEGEHDEKRANPPGAASAGLFKERGIPGEERSGSFPGDVDGRSGNEELGEGISSSEARCPSCGVEIRNPGARCSCGDPTAC